ncbi:MAG: HU family DNA-binding protein [Muribaculaceae bacterium]|nr:HU family DNA-binding protein [Muribaculaceae bacterium]
METKTLTDILSTRLDVSRDTIGILLDSFSSVLAETAVGQEGFTVPNFGVFEPRLRQERVSVHPASGKKLLVPPRITLTFKNSPVLKQKINYGK